MSKKVTRTLLTALMTMLIVGLAVLTGKTEWLTLLDQNPDPVTSLVDVSPSPTVLAAVTALPSSPSGVLATVTRIVDGDTFKVSINGTEATVRIVGINTPETKDPRRPVECFGKTASKRLSQLLQGQTVRLEVDETQADRDRYGRWLRFVYLSDGTDVGLQIITEGLAHQASYSQIPHRYFEQYQAAEAQAADAQRGLWQPNACDL